jgi:hypothetical protein
MSKIAMQKGAYTLDLGNMQTAGKAVAAQNHYALYVMPFHVLKIAMQNCVYTLDLGSMRTAGKACSASQNE